MNNKVRWGILGTGNIANKMADALKALPQAELAAVGSRTQAKSDEFGGKHGIPRCHGSYEELASDPDLDIIYVATPHTYHHTNSILCLESGKAVLCEKPFTVNAAQAEEVIKVARSKKLFLMEAMWTRYLPAMKRLKEYLSEGKIGDIRMIQADFGFRAGWDPKGRLLNPDLAGGGLLDVGVYTVSFAYRTLGRPDQIKSIAEIGETGVDEQNAILFGYNDGAIAILSSAIRTNTPQVAHIMGTEGNIRIPGFWCTQEFTLSTGGKEEVIKAPFEGNGFEFQAQEAMDCLGRGDLESSTMPLDETLSIMRTMDTIRDQWGLKYPGEN